MKALLSVEGLGKKYILRHQKKAQYATLRDTISDKFRRFVSPGRDQGHPGREEFWALKDVSLQVHAGDRIGVIGRNGAGKSTLLKILSRITKPTEGVARIRGRVSSLLEVGTGFHPELTGRENIFLNGSILGMSRSEIRSKFDEIVAFAEIEKFLDTPVKRYSSGMYVRLAFSVAAHLEPDVLIVDEVLAVGDAQFQKKCLGKMEEASRQEGRTVLLVSHNMAAIEALCTSALFLRKGQTQMLGPAPDVIREYMNDMNVAASTEVSQRTDRGGRGMLLLKEIATLDTVGTNAYSVGDPVRLGLLVQNRYPHPVSARFCVTLRNNADVGLIACDSFMMGEVLRLEGSSDTAVTCNILSPPLNYGEYFLNVTIMIDDQVEDWVGSALRITVESGAFHDHIRLGSFPILTRFEWKLTEN